MRTILRKQTAEGLNDRYEAAASKFDAEVEAINAGAESRERVIGEELAALQLEASNLRALKAKLNQ